MDPVEAFSELAASGPASPGEMAMLIAAVAAASAGSDAGDVAAEMARFDDLAAEFGGDSGAELIAWMRDRGFRGNVEDYYDVRNSMLDQVLDRGLGIPITLSIVAIEVGARAGIPMVGIGLPGEFILRERDDATAFHNPFRHTSFGPAGITRLLVSFGHHGVDPSPEIIEPVPAVRIIERMLANIVQIATGAGDGEVLDWALLLQTRLPGVNPAASRRLAILRAGLN